MGNKKCGDRVHFAGPLGIEKEVDRGNQKEWVWCGKRSSVGSGFLCKWGGGKVLGAVFRS